MFKGKLVDMATTSTFVQYRAEHAQMFGCTKAAILFAYVCGWVDEVKDKLGAYLTVERIALDTGLSAKEIRRAKKILLNAGVLVVTEIKRIHRVYFDVVVKRFNELFRAWVLGQEERYQIADDDGAAEQNNEPVEVVPKGQQDGDQREAGCLPKGNRVVTKGHLDIDKNKDKNNDKNEDKNDGSRETREGVRVNAHDPQPQALAEDRPVLSNLSPADNTKPLPEKTKKRQKRERVSSDDFEPLSALLDAGVDEQTAKDWLTIRKQSYGNKKPTLTQSALSLVQKEAQACGLTLNQAVQCAVANNWLGFRSEWYHNQHARANQPRQPVYQAQTKPSNAQVNQYSHTPTTGFYKQVGSATIYNPALAWLLDDEPAQTQQTQGAL